MLDPTRPLDESDFVRGWKAIASIVGLSERQARRRAQYGSPHRMPVWDDHRGAVARVTALRAWMIDGCLPVGVRRRLRAAEAVAATGGANAAHRKRGRGRRAELSDYRAGRKSTADE